MIPQLPDGIESRIPSVVRTAWQLHDRNVQRSRYYYFGDVFEQLLDDQETYQYPVRINLVKALLDKIAFFFWGQRNIGTPKHQIFGWQIDGDKGQEMVDALRRSYRLSRGDRLFHQVLVDALLDGLSWIRPKVTPGGVVLTEVLWEQGKPVYSPYDVATLDGVVHHYPIEASPSQDFVRVYWRNTVETVIADAVASLPNLYGFVPFVPFILFRDGANFMGQPFSKTLLGIQNELNARIADTGDGINNDAHPKVAICNTTANTKDLPTGVDAIWDLGMGSMNQEPKAWVLQGRGIGESGIAFSNMLKDFLDIVSHIPDIAMGRVAGSQRSGAALSTRLEVMVNAIETWRAFFLTSLVEMSEMVLRMHIIWAKEAAQPCGFTERDIDNSEIHVLLNPILRKDEREILDWNIQAVQSNLKHPADAMRDIGEQDPEGAYERVLEHMKLMQSLGVAMQQIHTTKTIKEE